MSLLMNQIVLNATRSNAPQPSVNYYVAFSHNYYGYARIYLSKLKINGSTPTVNDAGRYNETTLESSYSSAMISRVLSSLGQDIYTQGRSSKIRSMFNIGTVEPSTISWVPYQKSNNVEVYCELFSYDSSTGIWTQYNGYPLYSQATVTTLMAYVYNGTVSDIPPT